MAAGKGKWGFGWSERPPQPTHPLEELISGPLTTRETSGAEGGFLDGQGLAFFRRKRERERKRAEGVCMRTGREKKMQGLNKMEAACISHRADLYGHTMLDN